MLSGWHVAHLPVRINGKSRAYQLVDRVVVSWPELRIEGFLLTPRPFSTPFLEAHASYVLTDFGVAVAQAGEISRRTRRWRRDVLRRERRYHGLAVFDAAGNLQGRLKDVLFDERTLTITHLVVSRGVLGDLLSGALIVSRNEVLALDQEGVKIRHGREPLSMR